MIKVRVRVRVRVRFRERVSDNITFRPLKIFVNTGMAQTSTNLWVLRPIVSGLGLGLGLGLKVKVKVKVRLGLGLGLSLGFKV